MRDVVAEDCARSAPGVVHLHEVAWLDVGSVDREHRDRSLREVHRPPPEHHRWTRAPRIHERSAQLGMVPAGDRDRSQELRSFSMSGLRQRGRATWRRAASTALDADRRPRAPWTRRSCRATCRSRRWRHRRQEQRSGRAARVAVGRRRGDELRRRGHVPVALCPACHSASAAAMSLVTFAGPLDVRCADLVRKVAAAATASSAASACCGVLELRGNVIVLVGHGCCVMPCPPVRVTLHISRRGQRAMDCSSSRLRGVVVDRRPDERMPEDDLGAEWTSSSTSGGRVTSATTPRRSAAFSTTSDSPVGSAAATSRSVCRLDGSERKRRR